MPYKTHTFTKGSGCYRCVACGKLTRDDGNGDSVNSRVCTACFEEGGLENLHSDSHNSATAPAADCKFCQTEIKARKP